MNKPASTKKGFTLIELLTVIAILAILGAIIFPTVGQFRTLAKKSSDSNDLRNIVAASQMFAAQNGERFVGEAQTVTGGTFTDVDTDGGASTSIVDVAAVLAVGGQLTEPKTWVSENENKDLPGGGLYTGAAGAESVNTDYKPGHFSFDYVTGLSTWMPSQTPVAFSRMTSPTTDNTPWGNDDVYQTSGGHVAFLNQSVIWYDTLEDKLTGPTGTAVSNVVAALPTGLTETSIKQSAKIVAAP